MKQSYYIHFGNKCVAVGLCLSTESDDTIRRRALDQDDRVPLRGYDRGSDYGHYILKGTISRYNDPRSSE